MGVGQSEREALRSAAGDVEQELGLVPALILLCVDVERDGGYFTQQHVIGARREIVCEQTQREGAVAAAARLEEGERSVLTEKPLTISVARGVAVRGMSCSFASIRMVLTGFGGS